jgi:peptidoglycan/LPS O-acetylase OafA/YrhL
VYCRVGPYLTGMCAAFYYVKKEFKPSLLLEWLAFGLVLVTGFFGESLADSLDAPLVTFHFFIWHKSLHGLGASYLIACMLSEDSAGPSVVLRSCFSCNCCVPIATLSYSYYLLNMLSVVGLANLVPYFADADPFWSFSRTTEGY